MIGKEPGDLLWKEYHRADNPHGDPEKNASEHTALHGALPGAALLPEAYAERSDRNYQQPGAQRLKKGTGAGSADSGDESQRKATTDC